MYVVSSDDVLSLLQDHELKGSIMDFNKPGFLTLEKRRPFYLQKMLNEYSKLIYTDIDTVWKKDPRVYLDGDYDFWGQLDGILVEKKYFR